MIRWEYHCAAGSYYHTSLIGLVRDIVAHRLHHWRLGEGWVD